MTVQIGQVITDGTAVFIVDDVTDGRKTGDIIFRQILRPGYVKANGAILQAADYPRLLKYVKEYNLSVAEAEWQNKKGMYVYNEATGTLRVPDLRDIVIQGADTAGQSIGAGLPNVEGYISMGEMISCGAGGAFRVSNSYTPNTYRNRGDGYNSTVSLNATLSSAVYGKSTTVQPPAVAMIPQIKY